MKGWYELDRIIRGEATTRDALASSGLAVGLWPLLRVNLLLAAAYGICMGVFALFARPEPEFRQVVASMLKVPALFLLTLLVTFPSLYVFNTLLGSRLRLTDLARLLAAAMAVLLAVLAAFGPIVAFFSVTTTSYPFVLLLNVAVFAVSGAFGLGFLARTLELLARIAAEAARPRREPPEYLAEESLPVARRAGDPRPETNRVFYVWMVVFGLVGAQMAWVLRPFVGSPNAPFAWFRPRESSFFDALVRSVRAIFGE